MEEGYARRKKERAKRREGTNQMFYGNFRISP